MTEVFDDIVIGGGQAGPPLAARLAGAGRRVALIERRHMGGTCINTGCRPTKTLIASAKVAAMARRAGEFGVTAGPVVVDLRRRAVPGPAHRARGPAGTRGLAGRDAERHTDRGARALHRTEGAWRSATASSPPSAYSSTSAPAPSVPDLPGVREVPTLTNGDLLALDALPEHLVVVGGGYIGLEFAQAFRRFGSEVTIVEKGPRLIGREDPDVSEAVRRVLEAEGVRVRTDAECIRFRRRGSGVAVGVDCAQGAPEEIAQPRAPGHGPPAQHRRPRAGGGRGRAPTRRGTIRVDDRLATSVPGIWALGECNGRGAFTHTAYNDFEIVAANLLDGGDRKVSDRLPAYALYTDPPLGRVGMTEAEARASGRRVLVGKRPMTRVSRAVEKGETQGFIKVLADADTREILGAAILGIEGDEAVHAVLDLMYARAPVEAMLRSVHIHPTVSELIPTTFAEMRPLDP